VRFSEPRDEGVEFGPIRRAYAARFFLLHKVSYSTGFYGFAKCQHG
jgi:hypothetical protein